MPKHAQLPKSGYQVPKRPVKKGANTLLWLILGGAVLILFGCIAIASVPGAVSNVTAFLSGSSAAPVDSTPRVGEGSAWGPVGAKLLILDYSNFGCSHCANFALKQGKQLRSEYEAGGQVRFEFRHFRLGDSSTDDAANASECAADQGRFWDYHDKLFASQNTPNAFSKTNLKSYGAQLGLTADTFNKCVESGQHMDKVSRDSDEGLSKGITGTPTFYIGKDQLVGDVPYAQFKAKIDAALK